MPQWHGSESYQVSWLLELLSRIRACIPGRKQRRTPIKYDERRSRIEIIFGRLKDWRRAPTDVRRYFSQQSSSQQPSSIGYRP